MEQDENGLISALKPEKRNWKHYFGGFAFITIFLQLLTGLYIMFFFDPTLDNAYKSVQYISNKLFMGSMSRNLHRWIPTLMLISIFIHTVRSLLRKDFLKERMKVLWLTGVLLTLPLFLFLVTGLIVPWEWKGYWFMEMIPNYFEFLPVVGPGLKAFFLDSFTIPRYYVVHVVLLPLTFIVLLDYHIFRKMRQRGLFSYIVKHSIITLPLLILLFVLADVLPIPSDAAVMPPMPLEGEWVPSPEWYVLLVLYPIMVAKGAMIPILSIGLPLLIFFGLAFMPYYLRSKKEETPSDAPHERHHSNAWLRFWHNINNTAARRKIVSFVLVTFITLCFSGLFLVTQYSSPTLGCNSCHNVYQGVRMGDPPPTFKDRNKNPVLEDNDWMMKHWYFPNEIW